MIGKRVGATLLVATMALTAASASVAMPAVQSLDPRFAVGDPIPDFAFPSLDTGAPVRMSDFRGRKVMLHVFASW